MKHSSFAANSQTADCDETTIKVFLINFSKVLESFFCCSVRVISGCTAEKVHEKRVMCALPVKSTD